VFFSRRWPAVFAVLATTACQKQKAQEPPPHFAVVRFENLTGDSSLEWTGRAASEILAVSLQSGMEGPVLHTAAVSRLVQSLGVRSPGAPGVSTERTAALLAGANHVITGYVEKQNARFRVTASEENAATGKNVRTVSATENSFDAAVMKVASQFTPKVRPYLTAKPEAIRYYSAALEEPLDAAMRDFQKSLDADPGFGPAWVSRATLDTARGDRAAFAETVTEARRRKLDPFSLAQLDLEAAVLAGDTPGRIAALRKVDDLSPGDNGLLRALPELETAAGDFKAAAADWARVTVAAPADPEAWNNLGYTRSYTGDYAGALAALKEYARLRPNDANPLDSTGDVHYLFGKFAEAAAAYAQATQKDPDFERQGDLYKAAWAKFRAGDKTGADKLMDQFRTAREKQPDPLTPLFAADWLYRTGREPQAVTLLQRTAADAKTPDYRANALLQLAIWELVAGDRAKAAADLAALGRQATVPAAIAVFAAMPSASTDEWESRARNFFRGQPVSRAALAYALLLDGKREAALPVWEEATAATPVDFFPAAIVARLEGRKPQFEVLPTPATVNRFAAVLEKLTP
jgi:tetratricopeptide (TPR) repeat protein